MNFTYENILDCHNKECEVLGNEATILLLVEQCNYEEALHFINEIRVDSSPAMLISAVKCYLEVKQFYKALEILCRAEEKGWKLPKLYVLKGRCLYMLKEFQAAYESFQLAYAMHPNQETKEYMERCLLKLETPEKRILNINNVDYDTHQTDTHFIINLKVGNVPKDKISVVFNINVLQVQIFCNVFTFLEYNLFKEIVPDESSYKVTESCIEISLKKAEKAEWTSLEANPQEQIFN